jgi:hypothetical protein
MIRFLDDLENNPKTSPLVASGPEEPLARRGEGGGEREDKTWPFS